MAKLKWLSNAIAEQFVGFWALKLGGWLVGIIVGIFVYLFATDGGVSWYRAIIYCVAVALSCGILAHIISSMMARQSKEIVGAGSSQPMQQSQSGIVNAPHNEFKPHNEFNPHNEFKPTVIVNVPTSQTQSQQQSQTQRQAAQEQRTAPPPTLVRAGTRIIRRAINLEDGVVIAEEYYDDENDFLPTVKPVNVALARFRYKPEIGTPRSIYIRAHVFLLEGATDEVKDYDAVWWENEESMFQEFGADDRYEIIIALLASEANSPNNNNGITTYEYNTKPYDFGRYLAPKIHLLDATTVRAKVEITIKRGNTVIAVDEFEYKLELVPELKFVEI